MRLDRFITLNVVHPLHQACQWGHSHPTPARAALPILMYHSISDDTESSVPPYYRTCTAPGVFAGHLAAIKAAGYRGVNVSAGLAWLRSPALSGHPPIVLTFDDGFQDFHTAAFPILNEYGFTASVGLATAFIGKGLRQSFKSRNCLTWNEVRELSDCGIEFSSHTVTHPQLAVLEWPRIHSELHDSKHEIEQHLGKVVDGFTYPYAFPVTDKPFVNRLCETLIDVGYASCATTVIGRMFFNDNGYLLKRLPVNSLDQPELLMAKIQGDYDWLGNLQAIKKHLLPI